MNKVGSENYAVWINDQNLNILYYFIYALKYEKKWLI